MTYILGPFKHFSEVMGYPFLDLEPARRAAELSERRHAPIGDAAGNDKVEMAEVRGVVERETMAGDSARDSHPNRRQFFLAPPHASEAFDALRGDPVIGRDPNEHFLEIANVTVNVAQIGFHADHGVFHASL